MRLRDSAVALEAQLGSAHVRASQGRVLVNPPVQMRHPARFPNASISPVPELTCNADKNLKIQA